jgi:hypothetical protein
MGHEKRVHKPISCENWIQSLFAVHKPADLLRQA